MHTSKHWLWSNTLLKAYKANKITKEHLLQIINSMKAHLAKGNAYKAIKEIDDMINEVIE